MPVNNSAVDLIWQAGFIVKLVLLFLLTASIFSWTVILMKLRLFKVARKQSKEFLNTFWYGQDLDEIYKKSEKFTHSPVASVFKAGFKELKKISEVEKESKSESLRGEAISNVSRSLSRTTISEISNLEKMLGLLATVGSATPFVGLFGTVWGIMNSFQGIGTAGSANLAVVAPGIAEALIATAAGLAAAIPAVIAYNFFVGRVKSLANDMDTFSQDFLNIVQRSFYKS